MRIHIYLAYVKLNESNGVGIALQMLQSLLLLVIFAKLYLAIYLIRLITRARN